MANQSTLRLREVSPEDIPKISEVWFRAFSTTPHNLELFPDTPAVRTWWNEANYHDLVNKPYQKYLKVVDAAHPGDILAYGKWDLQPDRCGERYPPWHPESNAELCDQFFGGIEKQRRRLMQGREHYCTTPSPRLTYVGFNHVIDLDMLATNPDHQRRGAASLLVQWGCDQADRNGVAIYIASSKQGVGLYRKFGFELLGGLDDTPEGANPMVREPRRLN
ncbi:hypothetical protein AFCA_004722 [Aspergillus flavus]|uniref:DNA, SC111 n=3 Tax=Aspergillus subgen. Circumdati TaxID=2720871 RepID=Q2U806_ASPOR|nr:unnamed protein product [Aspergillus oryzae RIB40]KAJ1715737.1 acyl-CoA N-acyltransferase [Aspergillus flavus]GMG48108.1 unnamed protein product [Aspergillus oryzae var. brunneus]RMZ40632.1 hypothetical protein CA14_001455 [Aspergillus flavus]UDD57214.1 hypothetical protein AFCA_004722 [Aspergillus flavus]BAE62309.1 unnamed protein product [Aspergillus oryzae RIB40]